MTNAICPECRSGKHGNCTDEALDEQTDTIVSCSCAEQNHNPTGVGNLNLLMEP